MHSYLVQVTHTEVHRDFNCSVLSILGFIAVWFCKATVDWKFSRLCTAMTIKFGLDIYRNHLSQLFDIFIGTYQCFRLL